MSMIEKLTGGYTSSAKVVDGSLILSLPDAQSPVVWRMDLADAKEAALEVKQNEDGAFVLTMKSSSGAAKEIAPFDTRAKAVAALMAASKAMEHGNVTNINAGNNQHVAAVPTHQSNNSQLMAGVIGIAILLLLIFGLVKVGPSTTQTAPTSASETTSESTKAGQPMSADDFLMGR